MKREFIKKEHNQFIHNQSNLVKNSDSQTTLLSSMGLNVVCRYANCNIRLKNAKQRAIHENDAHNWKCGTLLNSCDRFLETKMSKKDQILKSAMLARQIEMENKRTIILEEVEHQCHRCKLLIESKKQLDVSAGSTGLDSELLTPLPS